MSIDASSKPNAPLVSVITPVYNGAAYIAECIESVLRQTHSNWAYTIADNGSTDDTVKIAARYAAADARIRIRTHDEVLPQIPNWNRALRYLEADAAYLKVVHADDWLYPECLAEMVSVAERNPSVGIVSAYRLEETRPSLGGIPAGQSVTRGRDVCRGTLAYDIFVFGSPTNTMIRADLVRKFDPFYDPRYLHADYEVCFRLLQESDLGFVFKVLTFTRRHNESYTSRHLRFNTYPTEDLLICRQYGPKCCTPAEVEALMRLRIRNHYRFLGRAVLQRRSREFWEYQRSAMRKAAVPINYLKLAYSVMLALLDAPQTLRSARRGAGA